MALSDNPYPAVITLSLLAVILSVFVVEFNEVNLGCDAQGAARTFFPGEPDRVNWVPIFPQETFSNRDEGVRREQFPLVLAWAITHWKAQGMTLRRVRVHLSARSAAVPGVAFVAVTRACATLET